MQSGVANHPELQMGDMKTNVFLGISIRIIALFSIAILATFIPEHLRDFFGDIPHVCSHEFCYHSGPDDGWDWGTRHYWFFWMCIVLFLLSLVNLIVSTVNIIKRNYETKNW